ncbi:putative amidohydrolase [Iodidimonas gelatinilytica]|uniref:Putative amidohydrolase n=1 Tax=Iodidimonas gelatinilytica TaxID=1236966 RepID=A0A5A7MSH5_9PROT|nr:amidohydrolase [Iodidimonas gelatinilytica]GEQ98756.1 putative amidohydrolase [Iodidimonas gelatinilytica]
MSDRWRSLIVPALLLASAPLAAQSQTDAEIHKAVASDYVYLENLYTHLHANPELSFQEANSAARMSEELQSLGFEVTPNVGGHGLVGVLKNGEGPTLLIRADMDALPVQEMTGKPYASTVTAVEQNGEDVHVMHACGHDVHMTVFVGTARRLAAMKDQWSGTLVMIGQPAEERGAGAKAMISDGLFQRFPLPDYNIALHVSSSLEAGRIAYVPGFALANVDSVDITVKGVGGHGAYPHSTKDPIVLASQIVMGLQTIASREVNPQDSVVVTVGSIHGGAKHNVISGQVKMQLTVRSYSDETRAYVLNAIERIAHNTARAFGLPDDLLPVVEVKDEYTPATYNDPQLTNRLAKALSDHLGAENVVKSNPVMGGEDFGRYGREGIPSVIFWLGAVEPEKVAAARRGEISLPSLHSPYFAPLPEPTIKTGVAAMTHAAVTLFGGE